MIVDDIVVSNVFMNLKKDFSMAKNRDSINKIYRQARIWVRFHCYYAEACTPEEARELNNRIKSLRWKRLEELGLATKTEV